MSSLRATQIVQTVVANSHLSPILVTQIVQTIVASPPTSALHDTQIVLGTLAVTPDISGVYYINIHKTDGLHDSYNGGVEKKIPNPLVRTALIGE